MPVVFCLNNNSLVTMFFSLSLHNFEADCPLFFSLAFERGNDFDFVILKLKPDFETNMFTEKIDSAQTTEKNV